MEFKEFRFDLIGKYGAIDRKWKVVEGGHKLIRTDGQDNELYFYHLPDFTTPGLRAWWKGLRTFNLVINKQEASLNLIQRWKLFGLLELKFSNVNRLITAKKKMLKQVKKASPMPALNSIKSLYFDSNEEGMVNINKLKVERNNTICSVPQPSRNSNLSSLAQFKENHETKLYEQLEREKKLEEKDPWYKDSYDAKIKRRAEAMMNSSVSKDELFSKRMEKIQRKITDMDKAIKRIHGD